MDICRGFTEATTSDPPGEHIAGFDEVCIQSIDCGDTVALTSSLLGWEWELTRLERGDFRVKGVTLALEGLRVAKLAFNRALLHRVRPPPGHVSVVLFGNSAGAIFVEGHKLALTDCVVLRAESDSEVVSQRECVAVALSMGETTWRRTSGLAQQDGTALRGGDQLWALERDSVCRLLQAVDSALRVFAPGSQDPIDAGTPGSFCERILALLRQARTEPQQRHALRRGRVRRRIGVERARDYIVTHLADQIRLSDLCRHTHLQARSLEYGFREIVGLSPVSYVKMMRLGEVHRRLLSRTERDRSISEIALDAGFCHLSQFAVDYKKLFMESPSATQGRATHQPSSSELKLRNEKRPTLPRRSVSSEIERASRAAWTQFTRTTVAFPGTC
jgi:AraC family ethanolamine operon transcriptional activator